MLTLLQQRADPDSQDARGYTALHAACAHNQASFVQLLLEAGANLEAQTQTGTRALHLATRVEG